MKFKHFSSQPSPAPSLITEQDTQPLPTLRGLAFQAFLARHKLSLLDVALTAGVCSLVVWNIAHDNPVSRLHAEVVRAALYRLTGAQYRGGMTLRLEHVGAEIKQQRCL